MKSFKEKVKSIIEENTTEDGCLLSDAIATSIEKLFIKPQPGLLHKDGRPIGFMRVCITNTEDSNGKEIIVNHAGDN